MMMESTQRSPTVPTGPSWASQMLPARTTPTTHTMMQMAHGMTSYPQLLMAQVLSRENLTQSEIKQSKRESRMV